MMMTRSLSQKQNGVVPIGVVPNGTLPTGIVPNGNMPTGIVPNGITVTAIISPEPRQERSFFQKCQERMEYYESKNKSLENSKDSLDLMYERKRGMGKSASADFPQTKNDDIAKEKFATIHQRRRRENSFESFQPNGRCPPEEVPRSIGLPRSISEIPNGGKWMCCEQLGRKSRRDRCSTFCPTQIGQKRRSESAELAGIIVEVGSEQLSRSCSTFRNNRSRSATIPRKWSEYNLSASSKSDDVDDLPDGSCFRRTIHRPNIRHNLNRRTAAIRNADYIGSFPVAGSDQSTRAEFVRTKLVQLNGKVKPRPVLLVISLAGIKVCSPDGKSVHMAHALRRISYATCDPDTSQFSFLAREPRGHFSLQYCHSFSTESPEQAEELNSIVGNAFRMAYAAQLQRQPTFQEVIASQLTESGGVKGDMSVALRLGGGKDPPRSIPGLRPHIGGDSNQSTPSSDESNSPTELNTYKRLSEKPPLVKRLTMGLTNNERTEETRPLVTSRPLSGGYVNEAVTDTETMQSAKLVDLDSSRLSQSSTEQEGKSKRISQISSSSGGSIPPPPPPARVDSLTGRAEEGELRAAPWFQAGIPREITLEVLGQEPVGAFMVRESTSKPGCYALSLRVPRDFQPTGIAHYLILRTAKGYKIKGFTKEFSSLTALITHHSVMPELLPCPLSLSRFNASFTQSDSGRDFADMDSDPDYDTLADFRRMMADLNV